MNAFLFLVDGPGSGDNGRVGEFPSVGELQGVTVGEKFCPEGVFKALGVTALMPRSLRTDARPMLTENVLQEFLRDRFLGVGGALKRNGNLQSKFMDEMKMDTHVGCLELKVDVDLDDI